MNGALQHIYVHVPFCSGKCAYCAFYSEPYSQRSAAEWLRAFEREFDLRLREAGVRRAAPETVYFGGGTPGLLPAAQLARLCEAVLTRIETRELREWSVETNPGTLDAEAVRVLTGNGVNRVSVGVQSFDDAILKMLGRRHTAAQAAETLDLLRAGGIGNVGIDLIASLPGVDRAAWEQALRTAAGLDPAHVSVYTLTPEPGTELSRQLDAGTLRLPDEDSQLIDLRTAERVLEEAGYERYEISNYARPGRACLHNVAFWRGEGYLGLGPAAVSRAGRRRRTNAPHLHGYLAALNEEKPPPGEEDELAAEDDLAERAAFALRLREGLDPRELSGRYGAASVGMAAAWRERLAYLAEHSLVVKYGDRWVATPRGWELADTLAAVLWGDMPECAKAGFARNPSL